MDTAYKDKVLRNLYEAIWAYQASVDGSQFDPDRLLGEVIVNAVKYPAIVADAMEDEIKRRKNLPL